MKCSWGDWWNHGFDGVDAWPMAAVGMASWGLQGKDAAAVADVRKGFERIHGWQTSGLGSWKVPDDWWIQICWHDFWLEHHGTHAEGHCKISLLHLPKDRDTFSSFLCRSSRRSHVSTSCHQPTCWTSWAMATILQGWSITFQSSSMQLPLACQVKGSFPKSTGLALNHWGQIHDNWMQHVFRWVELLEYMQRLEKAAN